MNFKLESLPYNTSALSPYMSAETLEYHHGKHHQTYVNNLNNLLETSDLKGKTLEEIVKNSYMKDDKVAIFNNASQHYNHMEFWQSMTPTANNKISDDLMSAITDSFGSLEQFKKDFIAAGAGVFGSGWVFLTIGNNGKLEIIKCANGIGPIALGQKHILGCDVWEHSYYIDYRNARPKYIESWLNNLVNWEYVDYKFKMDASG